MTTPLFLPQDVQEMDRRAFARGVASLDLMERAAGHLARGVLEAAGRAYGVRAAVLCGTGNNGGDGLAAARRLRTAGAYPVVHIAGDTAALSPDAAVQLRRWQARGGRLAASAGDALAGADVAVDCLLGTGARGAPRPAQRAVIATLDTFAGPVVACDLPSGVDAATGAVPGAAVRADLTVTLGAHKVGLWLWPARGHAGRIVLGDIGVVDAQARPRAWALDAADVAAAVPPPAPDAHKRSRGVVTVVAGARGMSGAATMTARGAMAAGAGLVTVATPQPVQAVVAASVPEALTVGLATDDPDAAFEAVAAQAERADALALGPGLGRDAGTVELVRRIVREVDVPLVVDADGLNAYRHRGDALAEHASSLLVATPHAAELARLVGAEVSEVWPRRLDLAGERAAAWDAVLVAKGPATLVAAADGRTWVNPTGSAALATGGTGDVLTGVLAALVAQRPDPATVAAAVWLHGAAGEEAAAGSHPRSVTALAVVAALPRALRRAEEAA